MKGALLLSEWKGKGEKERERINVAETHMFEHG